LFQEFIGSLDLVFTLTNLLAVLFGLVLGLFVGSLPGMGALTGMTILLPFTYHVSPLVALVALMALSKGSYYGDCIPGILFNMPGSSSAAITAIDGHALTKKGFPGTALQGSLFGSVGGDLLSDIVLLVSAAPLAMLALRVGPAENSMIILFALTIVGMVVLDDPAKGMVSVSLGIILGSVGRDPFLFTERFTFGILRLQDGIRLVPFLVGLLVISEIYNKFSKGKIETKEIKDEPIPGEEKGVEVEDKITRADARVILPSLMRGGIVGLFIGAVPGLGSTVGGFVAYTQAKRICKYREDSRENLLQGMVASEAGNSAVNGANLIPLLALGIPGSATAAVLYAAFMMQGIIPGPFIMRDQPGIVFALLITLILANVLLLFIGPYFVRVARQALKVPPAVLFPCILVISTVAVYSTQRAMFNVTLVFIFAILGFFMKRTGFPVLPTVIAFYLVPIFEEGFRRTLLISGGDYSVFLRSPISLFFIFATIISVAYSIFCIVKEAKKEKEA